MSLVVAHRYPNGIRLVADTRVTYESRDLPGEERGPRYLEGCLKLVIVNAAVCVGYVGTVNAATFALRRLSPANSADEVISGLREVSRTGDADFLVASLTPQPQLTTIRDGVVENNWTRAYIGSSDAWHRFQEIVEEIGGPGNSAAGFGGISTAMDRVIDEQVDPTVGDLAVEVRTETSGFRYTGHGRLSTGPITVGPGGAAHASEPWESPASGSYGETYVYPDDPIGAVGVYFYQGRLGVLFYPLKADFGLTYLGVTHEQFIDQVANEHGFRLTGSRVVETGPGNFELR